MTWGCDYIYSHWIGRANLTPIHIFLQQGKRYWPQIFTNTLSRHFGIALAYIKPEWKEGLKPLLPKMGMRELSPLGIWASTLRFNPCDKTIAAMMQGFWKHAFPSIIANKQASWCTLAHPNYYIIAIRWLKIWHFIPNKKNIAILWLYYQNKTMTNFPAKITLDAISESMRFLFSAEAYFWPP